MQERRGAAAGWSQLSRTIDRADGLPVVGALPLSPIPLTPDCDSPSQIFKLQEYGTYPRHLTDVSRL